MLRIHYTLMYVTECVSIGWEEEAVGGLALLALIYSIRGSQKCCLVERGNHQVVGEVYVHLLHTESRIYKTSNNDVV